MLSADRARAGPGPGQGAAVNQRVIRGCVVIKLFEVQDNDEYDA